MDIVRTYIKDGELWAETTSGDAVRWDRQLGRWSDPPFTNTSPDLNADPWGAHKPLTAPVSTIVDEQADMSLPTTVLDEAWNRNFPAFSGRRLAFGLLMLPVMSLVVVLWRSIGSGQPINWRVFFFTVIGGAVILSGTFAMRWVRDPASQDPMPSGLPDIDSTAAGWRVQRSPSMTPAKEILLSGSLFFIGMAGLMAFMDPTLLNLTALGLVFALSMGLAALIYRRAWMLLAVIFSGVAGFVPAFFLTIWGMFMGGSDSLWVNWAISSALLLLFALPFAWDVKRRAEVLQGRMRFPTWVIAGFTCVMMLLTGVFATTAPEASPRSTDVDPQVVWGPRQEHHPAGSPQAAAQRLFSAWSASDRKAADAYGAPDVVARLFSSPYSGQRFLGCGHLAGGDAVVCAVEMNNELLLLKPVRATEGFRVVEIQGVPSDTKLTGLGNGP